MRMCIVRMAMHAAFYPSASALELWLLCPARALAKYVAGYREPETDAMREGTRLHRITQRFLSDGVMPAMNELAARKIIGALPVPGGSIHPVNIERVLLLPNIHGFMDWATDDFRQGDLKFTSSVSYQRKKNPDKDPQRIFYAADMFHRDPFLPRLVQTWSVSQFNGAKAIRLDHEWTRRSVKKKIALHIAKPLDELQEAVHSQRDWQRAPKNFDNCNAFNKPCPMIAKGCKRSLSQRLSSMQPGDIRL